jgi:ATP-binding cassette subfamily B (MDR/TAP) protein 9
MDSLLSQDIGFFDTTKTGDITSRLSSDTTLVGDQVTLNVNVFLRSFVQAVGVLIFMFLISWQLSLLAFISVPAITVLSKWYGQFVRSLTKLMQKKVSLF